ncbi:MAG: HEAT repeat domain-containing protein [Sedimentisphaerales bacterium]|nr:HEAT repeat domain-containing protein [Sedimentisphaerales bacterium]
MHKQLFITLLTICLISSVTYARRNSTSVDIESLRKTLLEKNTAQGRETIQKLESDGSEEAISILLEFLTNNRMDRKLKQHALTSLGKIGTEPAIEAIKKFESWSQRRFSQTHTFQMAGQENPIDHIGPLPTVTLAKTIDSNKRTWILIPLDRYGRLDLFLTSLKEDDTWSELILLDIPGFPELGLLSETQWNIKCQLLIQNDLAKIECNDKSYEVKISDQLKDEDKDGLPDIVETRLLTDSKNSDSDSDGVSDGKDSNPLTPKHKETNDIIEIRQAAFSALFATSKSLNAIVVVDKDKFTKQEYYGFSGPVLRASEVRRGFVNVTSIDIKHQSETDATVTISDWEGGDSGSGHEAKLKKIHGKWVVVDFKMTWIS